MSCLLDHFLPPIPPIHIFQNPLQKDTVCHIVSYAAPLFCNCLHNIWGFSGTKTVKFDGEQKNDHDVVHG